VEDLPERLIGDKAYDSDPLDAALAAQGIQMISPHRRNRKKPKTQDGRVLRRYKRRWKIERLFAWLHNFRRFWLHNFRRLVTRWERKAQNFKAQNFLGFVQLGCIIILLRRL
jgi:transposase